MRSQYPDFIEDFKTQLFQMEGCGMSVRALKWAAEAMLLIDVPPTERAALWALSYHHNGKTNECFPSLKTLADWCGVSERRMRDAISLLIEWGLIKAKRGATPAGNASNRYALFGRAKRPRKTGRRVPVSKALKPAQKSRFETGRRVPVSNRQTSAADRGNGSYEKKDLPKLSIIEGGFSS